MDGILGIDVSKNTLDASMSSCNKVRTRSFANSLMDGAISWIG